MLTSLFAIPAMIFEYLDPLTGGRLQTIGLLNHGFYQALISRHRILQGVQLQSHSALTQLVLMLILIAFCLYQKLRVKHGQEKALNAMNHLISQIALKAAPDLMKSQNHLGGVSREFMKVTRSLGLFIGQPVVEQKNYFQFDMSICFLHQLAVKMGVSELMPTLCKLDFLFFENYNPHLRFSRSETIASGASRCDFCFHWDEESGT